mgnify:CR=1 FL=1|tara:strand:- start:987 stop:1607 length:621 start_codon:yes stop_codon:yes gene_type:complete
MPVVMKDIDFNKRNKNDYENNSNEMYSLKQYTNIAKKCISKFSGDGVSHSMLKSEDAISHVAEHIMWGHVRWREDGGRALKSYLNQCAIWAIKSWKTKIYKNEDIASLNYCKPSEAAGRETQAYQNVQDKKCKEPFELLYNNNLSEMKSLIESKCLTKLQSKCLYERYVEGKKLRQIAETLCVSRQAVNQHISKAVKKLRKENGIC